MGALEQHVSDQLRQITGEQRAAARQTAAQVSAATGRRGSAAPSRVSVRDTHDGARLTVTGPPVVVAALEALLSQSRAGKAVSTATALVSGDGVVLSR